MQSTFGVMAKQKDKQTGLVRQDWWAHSTFGANRQTGRQDWRRLSRRYNLLGRGVVVGGRGDLTLLQDLYSTGKHQYFVI